VSVGLGPDCRYGILAGHVELGATQGDPTGLCGGEGLMLAAARIRGFSVEDGEGRCPPGGRWGPTPARGHGFRSNGRLQIPVAFRVGDEIGARGCGAGYADV
jgi:hypothetical protein